MKAFKCLKDRLGNCSPLPLTNGEGKRRGYVSWPKSHSLRREELGEKVPGTTLMDVPCPLGLGKLELGQCVLKEIARGHLMA